MNLSSLFEHTVWAESLGWTLIHSLWQTALVALALGLLLRFSTQWSARIRYGISVVAIACIPLFAGITFAVYFTTAEPIPTTDDLSTLVALTAASGEVSTATTTDVAPAPPDFMPIIGGSWLLGMLGFSLFFLGKLLYVRQLVKEGRSGLPEQWVKQLELWQKQLGMKANIRLLESARVHAPVVVGWLKPVILIPVGMVNGLSQAEAEAILAHELAHIYRQDYLVNLLQSMLEIVFFFHPLTWWISNQIRQEREHCCDDLAVELHGDRLAYAKALTQLATISQSGTLALSFVGQQSGLLGRIQRLFGEPVRSKEYRAGLVAVLILVLSTLTYAFKPAEVLNEWDASGEIEKHEKAAASDQAAIVPLVFPAWQTQPTGIVLSADTNKKKKGAKAEPRLEINGKEVPREQWAEQMRLILEEMDEAERNVMMKQLLQEQQLAQAGEVEQLNEALQAKNREMQRVEMETRLRILDLERAMQELKFHAQENQQSVDEAEMVKLQRLMADQKYFWEKEQLEHEQELATLLESRARLSATQKPVDPRFPERWLTRSRSSLSQTTRLPETMEERENTVRLHTEQARLLAEQARVRSDQARIHSEEARLRSHLARSRADLGRVKADQNRIDLTQRLVIDGLLKSEDEMWKFSCDGKKVMFNGKRMDKKLEKSYLEWVEERYDLGENGERSFVIEVTKK